jgi:hypothetical protein
MGQFMKDDDYFIEPLLDVLNMRFAPGRPIKEMAQLQKRFQVFQNGRSFGDSVRLINAVGDDRRANGRWYQLLGWLLEVGSDTEQNGSDSIVSALMETLGARVPDPVYFTYHIATKNNPRVEIKTKNVAVEFMQDRFLTISLPLIPRSSSKKHSRG